MQEWQREPPRSGGVGWPQPVQVRKVLRRAATASSTACRMILTEALLGNERNHRKRRVISWGMGQSKTGRKTSTASALALTQTASG